MEKELITLQLEVYVPADSFTLICAGRVVNIPFDEIVRIGKIGGTAIIYTKDNTYKTHRSLGELLRELPMNQFFRINRSDVIALDKVNQFSKRQVFIGGVRLSLTQYYRKDLLRELGWMLEKQIKSLTHESRLSIAL